MELLYMTLCQRRTKSHTKNWSVTCKFIEVWENDVIRIFLLELIPASTYRSVKACTTFVTFPALPSSVRVEVRFYDCRAVAERLWFESNVRTGTCKISVGCCQNILEDIMGPCTSVEISYLLWTPLKNNITFYLHLSEDIVMWHQWLSVEHLLWENRWIIWLIFLMR